MRDESWYKMLIVSVVLHLVIVAAFSINIKGKARRILSPSSYYSVNLVGSFGPGGGGGSSKTAGRQVQAPEKTPPVPAKKEAKAPAATAKPLPARKEPKESKEVSLSAAKKKPVKESATPTSSELDRLRKRLTEIRKQAGPIEISRGGGSGSGSGSGGGVSFGAGGGDGRPVDPVTARYFQEISERITNAWRTPAMASSKRNLETIVVIHIRKDGRIVDIEVEKRSGNRIYDESVMRTLRAVDPLPPIPDSLNTDGLEIPFRFIPGDMS